jgi:Tfp pilus assembly protein PilO
MKFTSITWQRVAVVASALNLAGAGFAIAGGESWHAAAHVVLAVGFGLWAQRIGQRRHEDEIRTEVQDTLQSPLERLQSLEAEVGRMQQELYEVQERLDFTERVLTQGKESRKTP